MGCLIAFFEIQFNIENSSIEDSSISDDDSWYVAKRNGKQKNLNQEIKLDPSSAFTKLIMHPEQLTAYLPVDNADKKIITDKNISNTKFISASISSTPSSTTTKSKDNDNNNNDDDSMNDDSTTANNNNKGNSDSNSNNNGDNNNNSNNNNNENANKTINFKKSPSNEEYTFYIGHPTEHHLNYEENLKIGIQKTHQFCSHIHGLVPSIQFFPTKNDSVLRPFSNPNTSFPSEALDFFRTEERNGKNQIAFHLKVFMSITDIELHTQIRQYSINNKVTMVNDRILNKFHRQVGMIFGAHNRYHYWPDIANAINIKIQEILSPDCKFITDEVKQQINEICDYLSFTVEVFSAIPSFAKQSRQRVMIVHCHKIHEEVMKDILEVISDNFSKTLFNKCKGIELFPFSNNLNHIQLSKLTVASMEYIH